MSKKIAEGTAALVLDVKVGSGAFMQEIGDARLLAQTMVGLGAEAGVRTAALLTSMDAPLGRAVGNAVEVEEAVATLRGEGPPDLVEVTLARSEEHTSELQSHSDLVCRLLLEKKKKWYPHSTTSEL